MAETGRPSSYTEKIALIICERLSDGESLRSICRDPEMPAKTTVFKWLLDIDGFSNQYARAKEESAESHADDMLDIADETHNDHYIDENGNTKVNNEAIQRSRLRVDTRKWIASKLKPKKYGERIQNEITGANGGPVEITIVKTIVDPKKDT